VDNLLQVDIKSILLFAFMMLFCRNIFPLNYNYLSFDYLPSMRLQYEGSGYRNFNAGWTFKVKPNNNSFNFRWVFSSSDKISYIFSYLENFPQYSYGYEIQSSKMKLNLKNSRFGLKTPILDSSLEFVWGIEYSNVYLFQKDIVYNNQLYNITSKDKMYGFGIYQGFISTKKYKNFYSSVEMNVGNYLLTDNNYHVSGNSLKKYGYSNFLRLSIGYQKDKLNYGISFIRGLSRIDVPGGRTIENTPIVLSLPVNKFDYYGFGVFIGYEY
jgi:hypothetical protein